MIQRRDVDQIEADEEPLKTIQSSYQMQASIAAKKDWKLLFEMIEKSQQISAALSDLIRTPEG